MPNRVANLGTTEDPSVVTFHIRGREFVIREMAAEDYEDALRSAAVPGEDGKPTDKTDMLIFEKLLAVGSVSIDGQPVDLENWGKEKYPVTNRVMTEVKRLHWVDIETDEEVETRKKLVKDAEKDAKKGSDVPNS